MVALQPLFEGTAGGGLTLTAYCIQFALATGAAMFYFRKRQRPLLRFGFRWYNAPLTLWGLVLVTAVGVVIEPLMELFPESLFDRLNEAVGRGGITVLLLVVVAPLCEEIFFRGLVLEQVWRNRGTLWAVVASSLLFGLVHAPMWPQVVNAFAVGVILGYIYALSGSLIPVIIIHAVNNAAAYLMLEITGAQNTGFREIIGNDAVFWVVYAVAAVICGVSLYRMVVAGREAGRERMAQSNKTNQTPLHEHA